MGDPADVGRSPRRSTARYTSTSTSRCRALARAGGRGRRRSISNKAQHSGAPSRASRAGRRGRRLGLSRDAAAPGNSSPPGRCTRTTCAGGRCPETRGDSVVRRVLVAAGPRSIGCASTAARRSSAAATPAVLVRDNGRHPASLAAGRARSSSSHRGWPRVPVARRRRALGNPRRRGCPRHLRHSMLPDATCYHGAERPRSCSRGVRPPASAQIFVPQSLDRYFRIEWQVTRDRKGPAIEGYVYNTAAQTAERMRFGSTGRMLRRVVGNQPSGCTATSQEQRAYSARCPRSGELPRTGAPFDGLNGGGGGM